MAKRKGQCRLCIRVMHNKHLVDIFEEGANIATWIFQITGLEVSKKDAIPSTICKHCWTLLRIFLAFRETSIQANHLLSESCINTLELQDNWMGDRHKTLLKNFEEIILKNKTDVGNLYKQEISPATPNVVKEEIFIEDLTDIGTTIQQLDEKPDEEVVPVKDDFDVNDYYDNDANSFESNSNNSSNSSSNSSESEEEEYDSKTSKRVKVQRSKKEGDKSKPILEKSRKRSEDKFMTRVKKKNYDRIETICNMCGEKFAKASLERHINKAHLNNRPYKCEANNCHKEFYCKESLNDHVLVIHEKIGGGICNVCGKSFNRTSSLANHMTYHRDATIPCPLCPKMSKNNSDLRAHLRTHSNEKNYPCNVCDRSFANPRNLRVHMLNHTDSKKFQCEICLQKFAFNCRLKKHMDTNH